jgi:hypothetical protein
MEAALVREVYVDIPDQPWFNRNAVTERELLKAILAELPHMTGDPSNFASRCREVARARFAMRRR